MLDRWPTASKVWPLTSLQQGLAFESLALTDASYDPYRIQLSITLQGPLDIQRFEQALNALLARHTLLNLVLPAEMLEKGLGIELAQPLDWQVITAPEQELEPLMQADLHAPFDLERGPLIRARLIQTAPTVHHFILTNHHALLDGWSTPIVIADLAALYRGETLPPTLAWGEHLKWLTAQNTQTALDYWRHHLEGQPQAQLWTPDNKQAHPESTPSDPGEYIEHLPEALSTNLTRFARNQNLTTASVLQALYMLLLARLSSRDDITIGVTRSGRNGQQAGIDRAVGLYINTMPLRAQINLSQPLIAWMQDMQSEFAKQDEYLHVGLQQVQQMLGQQNLFDSPFVYANYPVDSSGLQFSRDLAITHVKGHSATHYGLALSVMHSSDDSNLILKVIYDQSLFEVRHISGIVARLVQMLQMIATEQVDQLCLGELRWSTDQERHEVLELFNKSGISTTALASDHQTTVPSILPNLFEHQVAKTPEALALVCGNERLTYRELDERANRLARHLLSKGIHADQIVAILMDRSTEMLVSLLAVLKVGAAYCAS
jgi:hypothetical protein